LLLLLGFWFRRLGLGYACFKLLNASRGIYEFFFTGIVGVASAADFNLYGFFGPAHFNDVAASATDLGLLIIGGMSVCFHDGAIIKENGQARKWVGGCRICGFLVVFFHVSNSF